MCDLVTRQEEKERRASARRGVACAYTCAVETKSVRLVGLTDGSSESNICSHDPNMRRRETPKQEPKLALALS